MGFISDLKVRLGLDNKGFKQGVDDSKKSAKSLFSSFKGFGLVAGAAIGFVTSKIVEVGKELINIGNAVTDAKAAFAKFGDAKLLDSLRAATRGTVKDLDLMNKAIKAVDIGANVDQLAKYFDFATQRSKTTGESIDSLVDGIVKGIGTGSTRAFTRLGISADRLNNELAKTGDLTTAVGNIIDSELATLNLDSAGIERMATQFDNLKEIIGVKLANATDAFFSALADGMKQTNTILADETITGWEKFRMIVTDFTGELRLNYFVEKQRHDFLTEMANERISAIRKEIDLTGRSRDELQSIIDYYKRFELSASDNVKEVSKAWILSAESQISAIDKVKEKEAELRMIAEEKAKEEAKAAAEKKAAADAEYKQNMRILASATPTIAAYEAIINANKERIKQTQNDEERQRLINQNKELEFQLILLNRSITKRNELKKVMEELKELEAKPAKLAVKVSDKPLTTSKPSISGADTSDLTSAVAKNNAAISALTEQEQEIKSLTDSMVDSLANVASNGFGQLADAISGISDMNAGEAVKSLLTPLADMAISTGTMIMFSGGAIEALKKSLLNFTGVGAIASGAALVAVGVAAKAGLGAIAKGGSSSGGSTAQTTVSGGSILGSNTRSAAQQSIKIEGVIKGDDIFLTNQKANQKRTKGWV